MKKQDLIDVLRKLVAENINPNTNTLSPQAAGHIIDQLFETIKSGLEQGESVTLTNFGKFSTFTRQDVRIPHPNPDLRAKGEYTTITGGTYCKFVASGDLKQRIKQAQQSA